MQETQVVSIEDEDDAFKMLAENINELKSRGLIDENLVVDDYIDIDFEVCTSKTHAMTDQEILDFVLSNDCAEEEEEKDKESEVNDVPPKKPKLSEITGAIELLECWFLFDNSRGEIRQSLSVILKKFGKISLETKTTIQNALFFQKAVSQKVLI